MPNYVINCSQEGLLGCDKEEEDYVEEDYVEERASKY